MSSVQTFVRFGRRCPFDRPARAAPLDLQHVPRTRAGQDFVLVNDHDPKPLYYHFKAEYDGTFTWDYLDEGPDVWRVRISRTA